MKKRKQKIIKAIKKKAAKSQNKKIVEKKKPKEVEMETDKISREGDVAIKFNQEMQVPSIISQKKDKTGRRVLYLQNFEICKDTGKRRLVGLSELDVSRDILDVTFVTVSDQEAKPIKYYLDMTKWDPTDLGMKINFDDPLMVGKGKDQVMTSLKDPSLFVSQASGTAISKKKATSVKAAKT